MKKSLIALGGIALSLGPVAYGMNAINVRSELEISQAPLTNALVIQIDSLEPNPHLRRFILDRKVQLAGLEVAREEQKGAFVIRASEIEAHSVLLLRSPDSNYYLSDDDFACSIAAPGFDRYSTYALTRARGQRAAEVWKTLLAKQSPVLKKTLESIRSQSESMALVQARNALQAWLIGVEAKYRKTVESETESVRKEWIKTAHCDPSKGRKTVREWREMVERPLFAETSKLSLLGRAPSRRYNGFYTVKLSVKLLGTTLNGRFLVDPMATSAILSSDWAQKQGVDPRRLLAGAQTTLKVSHSFGKVRGPVIRPDQVEIGGVKIPLSEWILGDAFFFDEPKYPARCCDGVIGIDFLKRFAIEFDPRDSTALILYPRESFAGRLGWSWDPIVFNADGVSKVLSDQIRATREQPVFVDAANGRYWYSSGGRMSKRALKLESPLKLEFQVGDDGSRQLIVTEIKSVPSTVNLISKGLKRGDIVRTIGSRRVDELDQTEVNALIDPAKLADIVITSEPR